MKKALKFEVDVKVQQRWNYIKSKVWDQSGMQLKKIKSQRNKLNFDQIPKLKSKKRCFEDKKKDRLDNSSSGYCSSR
jgi:hypothetical protein